MKSSVERRYNDFVNLHQSFVKVYEFRQIPRLPPKQFMLDTFLNERKIGLHRWLFLISQHPVLSKDEMFKKFLSETTAYVHSEPKYDEYDKIASNVQLPDFDDLENVVMKRDQMRKILNQLLTIKRLIKQHMKRQISQGKDYAEMASALENIVDITQESNLEDFSKNFHEASSMIENNQRNEDMFERMEVLTEVLISFNDLCDRILSQVENYHKEGNSQKPFRNIFRGNLNGEVDEKIENYRRRISFAIYCMAEEAKVSQKFLKLLPSILLQFTYEETKCSSNIANILQKIIDIESDKLN